MSISRLKTAAIVALALINAFFLTVIIIDRAAVARSERQAIEDACAVLRAGGITIYPENIFPVGAIRTMRTAREAEAEAMIAQAVLESAEITDQSVIYIYENAQRGTAEFASGGNFEIQLYEGVITNAGGTIRTVERLLENMGIEISNLVYAGGQETESVTVVCAYKGASIFNCTIEFTFRGDSLETVKGRYVTGFEAIAGDTEISSVGTALLGFLAEVRRGTLDCSRIDRIEAGYRHSVVGSFGEGSIDPVWLVITDSGRYIIDDATGAIAPVA